MYLIEAESFEFGAPLSRPVELAMDRLVDHLVAADQPASTQ